MTDEASLLCGAFDRMGLSVRAYDRLYPTLDAGHCMARQNKADPCDTTA